MSIARPLRALFGSPFKSPSCVCQGFHTSGSRYARVPKYPNIKASDLGLIQNKDPSEDPPPKDLLVSSLKPYSKKEREALTQIYSPEQLEAIKAGERAINHRHIYKQGAFREDSFALPYFDDLSYVHPVIDKPVRAPESNYDPNLRFKNEDELLDDITGWAHKLPEDATSLDWIKFRDNVRLTVGKEEAERNPRSYLAPELRKIKSLPPQGNNDEIDPATRRLMLQTGYSLEEIRRFRVKVLVIHRVVNQTRMGKVDSMYFLAIAGNAKGMLGIGEGKSIESEDARKQAAMTAIRNMVPIPRYEERTIYGDVTGKVGATEVEVMTRPPGQYTSMHF